MYSDKIIEQQIPVKLFWNKFKLVNPVNNAILDGIVPTLQEKIIQYRQHQIQSNSYKYNNIT